MLSSITFSSAQNLYHNPEWLLPPNQVSFTLGGASSSGTSVPGTAYEVSNAAFDEAGSLLFYVKDGQVFDASHRFDTQFRLANPHQTLTEEPSMAVKVWPNPASSNAVVEYQLPAEGLVRMDLMDAHGRIVATPIRTYQSMGGHRRKLDLHQIPAGIYQWRMVAGQEVQQGRLIKQ
jgi:hypothetical protein